MKQEEKFLLTGLLVSIFGYILFKVWTPEPKATVLQGFIAPKAETQTVIAKIEIPELDALALRRAQVTNSINN